jgi:hypothetical protein
MPPCKNPSRSCCGTSTCGATIKSSANVNDGNGCSSSNTSTDHPKNLKLAVQSSSTRLTSNGDIAQDVYRTIRDEAHLLLERQLISDALDSDPFELMKMTPSSCDDDNVDEEEEQQDDDDNNGSVLLDKKKNREMIERFKDMMSVISCDRTTTLEGYSSIHAVVQLTNDGMMSGVNENIRLYFTFVREPQHSNTANDYGGDSKGGGGEAGLQPVDADNADDNSSQDVVDDYSENPGKRKRGQGDEIDNKRTRLEQQEDERDECYDDDEVSDKDADNFEPKTIVTYKIDMSIDYGQRETLLGVDVYALGHQPSVEEAVPMMSDEAEDDENEEDPQLMADEDEGVDSDADCNGRRESNESSNMKQPISKVNDTEFEVEMADTDDDNVQEEGDVGRGDRFGVFVDPQCIVSFLDRINMNLNEQSVIYFLLTFPFYEHEWDLSGFILSMFDDGEMEHEEEDDSCTSAHS